MVLAVILYAEGTRGPLLNSKYVMHNACVYVPFPFKEGGGNGEVLHICTRKWMQHIFTI